jgi:hypothetical protein
MTDTPALNEDGEVVLALANGWTLRSGGEDFTSGEYVRLVDPHGEEHLQWHQAEWAADPALVMGAIINTAIVLPAGVTTVDEDAARLDDERFGLQDADVEPTTKVRLSVDLEHHGSCTPSELHGMAIDALMEVCHVANDNGITVLGADDIQPVGHHRRLAAAKTLGMALPPHLSTLAFASEYRRLLGRRTNVDRAVIQEEIAAADRAIAFHVARQKAAEQEPDREPTAEDEFFWDQLEEWKKGGDQG